MITKSSIDSGQDCLARRGMTGLLFIGLLFVLGWMSMPVVAQEGDSPVPADAAKCLKCHSKTLKKTLGDGEKLSLHVESGAFQGSVHGDNDCVSCHTAIAERKHPKEKVEFASKRAYSIEQNQACSECHEANSMLYQGGIHASLVAEGNAIAPVCSDCHSAHAIQSMAVAKKVTGEVCKNCHEEIYEAYTESVHGTASANGNVIRASNIQAPMCADCHKAHDTAAVSAGELVQATCLQCHDDASLAHQQWLPNASQHLEVISCAACHSPLAERRIDLQLVDKNTRAPVGGEDNQGAFQTSLEQADGDGNGNGLSSSDLWKLVNRTEQEGVPTDVKLQGRMEVSTGAEKHRLAVKSSAVRDCESCHQKGSSAFEKVTVSVNLPDGRRQRFAAEGGVLNSAASVDMLGGFYAIGGTRIHLLDILLVLGIAGGLGIPIAHMALGKILGKMKAREDN